MPGPLYRNEHGEITPPIVRSTNMPRRYSYERYESYLRNWADRTFETAEFAKAMPPELSFGRHIEQAIKYLWHAGYRVTDTKPMRKGWAYTWARNPDTPWPQIFAPINQFDKGEQLAAIDALARIPVESDPQPEPEEQNMTEDQMDVELGLAEEQERRAIKAERERDNLQASLDEEKARHAETRSSLMRRVATQESKITQQSAELTRVRLKLEEEIAAGAEPVPSGDSESAMRRAHDAEAALEEMRARLDSALGTIAYLSGDGGPAKAATPVLDEGWWPMEPQPGQDLAVLLTNAGAYGLEMRIQARKKLDVRR